MASLARFLDDVSDGPSALLLAGAAGMGKTTVWRAGVDLARARNVRVLLSRPGETETHLPYSGLGDLLADVADEDLARLPPRPRRAVAVALLRTDATDRPIEQRAIGVGLLAILGLLAAHGPLLIAIDDAQWLDEPSARVLQFALRRLRSEPVGILVATRPTRDGTDVFGLAQGLPQAQVQRLEVGALDLPEVDRLLQLRLGVSLPRGTLRRLHDLSSGNPFFALEIGRAIGRQRTPAAAEPGLPVPDTLRELVLERLYHLPGTTREVLLVLAAMSRPTLEALHAALPDDRRVGASVTRAEDAGVIEVDGDAIRFSHPLLGSVLYRDMPPGTRRRLHRRLATVVTDPDERARHLALGAVGPDETAARELEAAATRTRSRGAPDAAAALAEQACRLTPAGLAADATRRTLLAGDAYLEAGISRRAAQLLEPLVDSLPPGPDQARALHGLGRVRMIEAGLRQAEPLLERALALAGDDALLQASIGRDLSTALTQTGDLRRAEDGARSTLEWAERTELPELVASALVQLAMVEFLLGRGIHQELLGRAAALTGEDPDLGVATSPAYVPTDLVWGAVLKWSDQFDLARARFDAVRSRAIASGDETPWLSLLFQAGELELWAGRWDEAARLSDEARGAADRRLPAMQQDHTYLIAAIEAHRGNEPAARAAVEIALGQAQRTGDLRFLIRCHAILGFLELSLGDPAAAAAHLGQAWAPFRDAGYDDPGVIRFAPDLIEALLLGDASDKAVEILAWLEERGTALDRPYALATGARCRALVLGSAGRLDAALATIDGALEHHRRLPQPFELARTQLVRGGLLRRAKAKREGRDALTAALATFTELGATLWAERTRAELRRISGRAPTVTGLTPTEGQVAQLAADGYGNQQIADRLFVSAKTVEAHLTRIYDKLGVRSRGELARRSRTGDIPDFDAGPGR